MSETVKHVSCQEVVDLVTDYLEGALSPTGLARFEHHLTICDGCAYYVERIRMTIEAVGRIGEDDVPPEIRDGLLAAFRDIKRS